MVNVVKRSSVKHRIKFFGTWSFQYTAYGGFQGLVFPFEQRQISAPSRFRGFPFFRPREKIASLQNERSALRSFDASSHGVFPVGGMQRELPDVVPARRRTPSSFAGRDAFQRLAQIRAVPSFVGITVIQKRKDQVTRVHGCPRK